MTRGGSRAEGQRLNVFIAMTRCYWCINCLRLCQSTIYSWLFFFCRDSAIDSEFSKMMPFNEKHSLNLQARVTAETGLKIALMTTCARRRTFRSDCCLVLEHWLLRHIDCEDMKWYEDDLDLSDVFNVSTVISWIFMDQCFRRASRCLRQPAQLKWGLESWKGEVRNTCWLYLVTEFGNV
jgi:hypothetical protein